MVTLEPWMKLMFCLVALVATTASAQTAEKSDAPSEQQVDALLRKAESEVDHPLKALEMLRAAWANGMHAATLAYDAGCFAARAGRVDEAFMWLERSAAGGFSRGGTVDQDPDLLSLHKDPRYARIQREFARNEEARLASEHPADPKLQHELLAMAKKDQDARNHLDVVGHHDQQALAQMKAIDAENLPRMKAIIDRYGWPGITLVGRSAEQAAWILIQHSDTDVAFQQRCLKLLEQAVKAKEATAQQLAYLTDRVRVHQKKPQRYGTQLTEKDGKVVPLPLENASKVDAWRAEIGLDSLGHYVAMVNQLQGSVPK